MDNQNSLLVEMIQEGLHSNGWARFRVVSNSMLPLIRKNDWVQAAGLSSEDNLHFGDIILYRRNKDIIIHRVIRCGAGQVTTKGDRCLYADTPVLRIGCAGQSDAIGAWQADDGFTKPRVEDSEYHIGSFFTTGGRLFFNLQEVEPEISGDCMMDLNCVPVRNKTIVYQIVDDEAVLVLPTEGKVKVLNKVGAFIWQTIDNQKTVKEIVNQVVAGFEVSHEEAARDTLSFLEELAAKAVIQY